MTSTRVTVLFSLLLAACASGGMGAGAGDPRTESQIGRAESELRELEGELQRAGMSQAIDCAQACELAERICSLASRICALGARSPDPTVTARCDDSQGRCLRARDRVSASCTCR